VTPAFRSQEGFDVRFEWGPKAVEHLAPLSRVVVIVDVLRFSTAVDAVVSAGGRVRPLRWADRAGKAATDRYLSPVALAAETRPGDVVELPSPNGAELTVRAAGSGATIFAGCIRNGAAVAAAATRARADGVITVIACGERWEDGETLRPGVEDLLGAGAVLASLGGGFSPEASMARQLFLSFASNPYELLAECASARELGERGFPDDVRWAADANVSSAAPRLFDGVYGPA
jgi:2-phosphosulfolactate phosphatase